MITNVKFLLIASRLVRRLDLVVVIVCLCHVVTDKQVKAAISDGATSVDDVGERTRAGTGCGGCREEVHSILDSAGVSCEGGCPDCPRRREAIASPYVSISGEAA
jgi:bacterioferritin-associated ferredoxin